MNLGFKDHIDSGSPGRFSLPTMSERQLLRQQLRARRRALSTSAQQRASIRLLQGLRQHHWFTKSRHIALYLANDGEIDPAHLIAWCRQHHKQLYLPVLHPLNHGELWFYPWHQHTHLCANRFGIPEPALRQRGRLRPLWALDLVLLPLVGFDPAGNRMGMGGGFYDRTLVKLERGSLRRPRLIGLAHECQKVERLPIASWDIPLQGIQSDRCYYGC